MDTPPKTAAITKAEAVRHALAEGVDNPTKGVALIKKRFGLSVTPSGFSAYKSMEQSRAKKRNGKALQVKKVKLVKKPATPAPRPGVSTRPPEDLMEAVIVIKRLVDKHGVDTVRELVALFD